MSQQVAANSQKLYTQTLPSASFSTSVGGMFSAPGIASTVRYVVDGNWISLILPQLVAPATVAAFTLTLGTIPQALWPRSDQNIPCVVRIGAASVVGFAKITTAGVMTMTSPTASSTGGPDAGFESQTINYPIA